MKSIGMRSICRPRVFYIWVVVFFAGNLSVFASALTLDEIIGRVEKRYMDSGFSVQFVQVSTLKAMNIEDTATGRLFVKHPGMMRWEYEKPDKQTIITDGTKLWIHRPDDNQVMIGKAPSFFGDGKGAGFLSDIKRVQQISR